MRKIRKRIAVLAGIRSHYVKLAAFQRGVEKYRRSYGDFFDFVYIDAAQHYDYELAGGFINELDVKFDKRIEFNVQNPIDVYAEMYKNLSHYIQQEQAKNPFDFFIVFGDANTTSVGALAANKQRVPVVHIEAGLRLSSFSGPEESNSVIADHLSTVCCASSHHSYENLS